MWLLGFPISWVCDFALQRNASVIVVRKISNSVGLWVPAAAMIALSVVTTTDKNILIGILAIAIGFNSGITCGFQINHIDLSPNFAGIMMSLTNGAANVFGIIAPIVCDNVVDDPVSRTIKNCYYKQIPSSFFHCYKHTITFIHRAMSRNGI